MIKVSFAKKLRNNRKLDVRQPGVANLILSFRPCSQGPKRGTLNRPFINFYYMAPLLGFSELASCLYLA